ncbi:hypothetical protein Nepgr_033496 [Nepenthes gracilis]|uniref:DUF218 domain-containing protein n=1 Tax=Nepenthes gracilis TaxID=150966 RepID=A0AAD3TMQ4_NEPGR|nr:hypothetical protein Nepgr_033496 [Nepenthes gracilis]
MSGRSFGPGNPNPFDAYPRGEFDVESLNFKNTRRAKTSKLNPIKMLKSIANRIQYFCKLHPLLFLFISLSCGVTALVILSFNVSRLQMMSKNKKFEMGQDKIPFSKLKNLVMVAGHSVYTSSSCGKVDDENSWFLESYQKHPGQAATFLAHIQQGVEAAATDDAAVLLFSGGETRKDAGPLSEAQSYWLVAEAKRWFGEQEKVRWRALTEEHARDSFENLLFSICRFREITGAYPQNITVVSYDFKEGRFESLHRSALRYPASRFFYIGTPTSATAAETAKRSEALVRAQFQRDPYGCQGSLYHKKLGRDPFHRSIPYPRGCPEIEGLFRYCGAAPYPGTLPWP